MYNRIEEIMTYDDVLLFVMKITFIPVDTCPSWLWLEFFLNFIKNTIVLPLWMYQIRNGISFLSMVFNKQPHKWFIIILVGCIWAMGTIPRMCFLSMLTLYASLRRYSTRNNEQIGSLRKNWRSSEPRIWIH